MSLLPENTGSNLSQQPAPLGTFTPGKPGCWRHIGVFGNHSCPELAALFHCRDCPTFSTATLEVLGKPIPKSYREERTEVFSRPESTPEIATSTVLLFRVHREWLALHIEVLQEVAERRKVHSLPHRSSGVVLGLVNVRGELLICASLGHCIGVQDMPSPKHLRNTYPRLLVVNWHGFRLALPVDEVPGIHRLHGQEITPPPRTVSQALTTFTQGIFYWKQMPVAVLNADALFSALNQSLS